MKKTWVLEIDDRRRVAIGKLFDSTVERILVSVDDAGVFRMEPATVVPSAVARLFADPAAQADLEAALDVSDPAQNFRKRIPRGERKSPDQRSKPLTSTQRRKLQLRKSP